MLLVHGRRGPLHFYAYLPSLYKLQDPVYSKVDQTHCSNSITRKAAATWSDRNHQTHPLNVESGFFLITYPELVFLQLLIEQ